MLRPVDPDAAQPRRLCSPAWQRLRAMARSAGHPRMTLGERMVRAVRQRAIPAESEDALWRGLLPVEREYVMRCADWAWRRTDPVGAVVEAPL